MATRRANIYINGKEIKNDIKSIVTEKRKLVRELNHMTIGSKEYNAQIKKIENLNPIINKHRQTLRGVDGAWKKMGKAIGSFAGIAGVALGVQEVIQYGKEIFKLGSEMQLLEKKAKTVFGDALPLVSREAERNAAAMGLTTSKYIDAAAAMGDLLIPMKFTRQEAAAISTQLVNLSGALSEWTGGQRSAEEVSKILGKALLGEREQLKELGISILEADVKARLAEKGLQGLTGEMLQQAKTAATLELITEKTADAQFAYAENSNSLVRKQSELRAQFQDIKETMASALIPVFSRLLEHVGPVVSSFARFIKALISGEKQTGKFSGVMKVLGVIVRNAWKGWSAFYSVIFKFGKYLYDKLSPAISVVAGLLIDFYNTVVKGVNKLNELLGFELRLEKIDTSILNKELEKEQKKLEENPLEVEVKTKTNSDGVSPEEAAEIQRQKEAAARRAKEKKKEEDREAKELERRLNRTKALIERHAEELRIAELNEDEQKIERIKAKYAREIAEAEGFTEQIKELERLRDLEIKQQREQFQARDDEEKALLQEKLRIELLSEQELELLELENHFQNLLSQAEQYGIDVSALKVEYEERKKAIDEKYKKQQEARDQEADDKKLANLKALEEAEQELVSARLGLYGAMADQLSGLFKENEKLLTGLFLFQKGLAAAEVIIKLQQELAAIRAKNSAIPVVGPALTIAESTTARIRAATSLATIAGTVIQRFAQKKEGRWLNATGADDNTSYRVRYIGQPVSGMLPDHPVLMNTTGGPVIASEAGQEYFVSNRDLSNPKVLNYVRAIDNIVKYRQYASGGSTNGPIQSPPENIQNTEQAEDSVNAEMLIAINRLNENIEGGLIALINDETIISLFKKYNQLQDAAGGGL